MTTIKLYNNTSPNNKLDKTIAQIGATISGTFKSDCSVINPEIMLEINDFPAANYMYITAFNRYYFITDIINNYNNIWTIKGRVDVLESYKNSIKNQKIIIDKSTNNYDNYLPDENLKTNVKTKTDILNFSGGFLESGEFILITAGG